MLYYLWIRSLSTITERETRSNCIRMNNSATLSDRVRWGQTNLRADNSWILFPSITGPLLGGERERRIWLWERPLLSDAPAPDSHTSRTSLFWDFDSIEKYRESAARATRQNGRPAACQGERTPRARLVAGVQPHDSSCQGVYDPAG